MQSRNKPHFGIADHYVSHRKSKRTFLDKVRFIVERTFGTVKKHFDFQRAKYKGVAKVQAEFMLISMAHNIKKAVYAC